MLRPNRNRKDKHRARHPGIRLSFYKEWRERSTSKGWRDHLI
jgi:hypothetical protein